MFREAAGGGGGGLRAPTSRVLRPLRGHGPASSQTVTRYRCVPKGAQRGSGGHGRTHRRVGVRPRAPGPPDWIAPLGPRAAWRPEELKRAAPGGGDRDPLPGLARDPGSHKDTTRSPPLLQTGPKSGAPPATRRGEGTRCRQPGESTEAAFVEGPPPGGDAALRPQLDTGAPSVTGAPPPPLTHHLLPEQGSTTSHPGA